VDRSAVDTITKLPLECQPAASKAKRANEKGRKVAAAAPELAEAAKSKVIPKQRRQTAKMKRDKRFDAFVMAILALDPTMIDQEQDVPTGWGIVNNEVCGLSRTSCYTLFSAYLKQLETKLQQNPIFMTTVIKRAVWRCTALYDDQCPAMEEDLIQAWANAGTPPECNKGLAAATLRTYKMGMPLPKHEWAYG
jgi:hypothetical protein